MMKINQIKVVRFLYLLMYVIPITLSIYFDFNGVIVGMVISFALFFYIGAIRCNLCGDYFHPRSVDFLYNIIFKGRCRSCWIRNNISKNKFPKENKK